jgi:hypothetical protein
MVSAAVIASALAAATAIAQGYPPRGGYVVAESRFGNGTVSGPVRETGRGRQVRLPGGSWIYCRVSCSETLREETVDFWETRAPGGGVGARFGILNYWWR